MSFFNSANQCIHIEVCVWNFIRKVFAPTKDGGQAYDCILTIWNISPSQFQFHISDLETRSGFKPCFENIGFFSYNFRPTTLTRSCFHFDNCKIYGFKMVSEVQVHQRWIFVEIIILQILKVRIWQKATHFQWLAVLEKAGGRKYSTDMLFFCRIQKQRLTKET